MIVKLDDEAKKTIEEIIKRGNDAKVRRSKGGIVIFEEVQKIKYRNAD